MPNSPNQDYRDPNYRKDGSSAGWWIAGIIAVVIIVVALYQNHVRTGNLQNIEPAAGNVTTTSPNTYDMQNSNTTGSDTNTTNTVTNTTTP